MENIVITPKQLLRIENVNGVYEIGAVTEKAVMIKCDDGKWGGNGFKPLWMPKSIMQYIRFNDNRDNSQFGIHVVNVADWFVNKNSKLL